MPVTQRIITFGEILMRLSTVNSARWTQSRMFQLDYGGPSSNVAANLALWNHEVRYVTKLPPNDFGDSAINYLRGFGIDLDYIARGGSRMGIYFVEPGVALRRGRRIYDRAHSSLSEATADDFDFDEILRNGALLFWSGMTAGISQQASELIKTACEIAKQYGLTVVCDLNYRKQQWSPREAQRVIRPLMQNVDICIGSRDDIENCLGYVIEPNKQTGELDAKSYETVFHRIQQEFGFKYIATTLRKEYSVSHIDSKAILYDGKDLLESQNYDINPILDRVAVGDAFTSGLIHGLLTQVSTQRALEWAIAASAYKYTISGVIDRVSVSEVETLIAEHNANMILH